MTYIKHDVLLVTGNEGAVKAARTQAFALWHDAPPFTASCVTPIARSIANGIYTFMVVPDGATEGSETSDLGDILRDRFILWLERARPWAPLDWVEVRYGGDDEFNGVMRSTHDPEGGAQ